MGKAKLVCIVSPTAVGKTGLAIELALELGGEVISADSMQIYKGMDIGTAKPSAAEMRGVPHHMLDVVHPNEDYSAARYAKEAGGVLRDIISRGKLPIVAGGSGLYVDALLSGDTFAPKPESNEIRLELERLADEKGSGAVYAILENIDHGSAKNIHRNNLKRVIRAIEICRTSGVKFSELSETQKKERLFDAVMIGLNIVPRSRLYERIDARVDEMMKNGLYAEVEALLKLGIRKDGTAMQAIGYKELAPVVEGDGDISTAVSLIKKRSRNYAKRQLTWFKRDESVLWFEHSGGDDFSYVKERIKEHIKNKLQEE